MAPDRYGVSYRSYTRFHLGGVVGNNSGEVSNVTSSTEISVSNIGTSAGHSATYACVYPYTMVGGAVGQNYGKIELCSVDTQISAVSKMVKNSHSGVDNIILYGGLVRCNEGTVSECRASGSIEVGHNFIDVQAGGFVHFNKGTIKNCSTDVSLASVRTISDVDSTILGGFVALNEGGTIASSYSAGNIQTEAGGACGGFVGQNKSGSVISKCFSAGNITYTDSVTNIGCFAGIAEDGSTFFKNYYSKSAKIMIDTTDVTVEDTNAKPTTVAALQGDIFLVDDLGWSKDVWNFMDGKYPTLAFENQ